MKLSVFMTPGDLVPGDVAGCVVAVVDVLRASTTIATALANGARSVIPVETADIAISMAKQFEHSEVTLAGERKMLPIPGFDLGNSPLSFTEAAIGGRTVLLTTTNGTRALMSLHGTRDVVLGAYVNHAVVSAVLRAAARAEIDISIVCAGDEGHFSLEDAACAGRFVRSVSQRMKSIVLNDAACACEIIDRKYGDNIAKIFRDSTHGQALAEAGFNDDLVACAALDSKPVVPDFHDRQITRIGLDRER